MIIVYVLIGLVVTILISVSLFFFRMYIILKNDRKLRKLKYEIENEDNDGWSKLYYKSLYQKRKKELIDSMNPLIFLIDNF
jgi:hypothetical protein